MIYFTLKFLVYARNIIYDAFTCKPENMQLKIILLNIPT